MDRGGEAEEGGGGGEDRSEVGVVDQTCVSWVVSQSASIRVEE